MPPKTSIILCTYNEANYIENAILELEKNITNLEIVIVDDSSSDGTIEVIKKLNQNSKYKVIYRSPIYFRKIIRKRSIYFFRFSTQFNYY